MSRALRVLWLLLVAMHAAAADAPVLDVRAEPAAAPWWQRATLSPKATKVHGIAIKRLHPDWCAAEAFERELFGAERLLALAEGQGFSVEGDFDGSGRPQRAFVGAYRRCAGEQGLFLAIVEPHAQRPRMRFLLEVPDPGSAVALVGRESDGTLAVWWCLGCDNGHRIAFNRETRGYYVAGPAARR